MKEKEAWTLLIIERMDDLEELGADFTHAKRLILRLAREYGLFSTLEDKLRPSKKRL